MLRRRSGLLLGLLLGACANGTDQPPSGEAGRSQAIRSPAGPTAHASSVASDSDELVRMPGLDASISLPPDWTVLTYSDVGDGFDEARATYPDAAELLDNTEQQMQEGSVRFLAFESEAGEDGFIANLTVGRVPGTPPSADDIARQIAASIQQELDVKGDVKAGTATVEAGEVALVTFVLRSQVPPNVWVTQFAYPRETDGLVLTLAAPNGSADAYGGTWQEIADSVTY